jgi:hypothetical protein
METFDIPFMESVRDYLRATRDMLDAAKAGDAPLSTRCHARRFETISYAASLARRHRGDLATAVLALEATHGALAVAEQEPAGPRRTNVRQERLMELQDADIRLVHAYMCCRQFLRVICTDLNARETP